MELQFWAVRVVYIRVVNSWLSWGTVDTAINFHAQLVKRCRTKFMCELARDPCVVINTNFCDIFSCIGGIGIIVTLNRSLSHRLLALLHMLVRYSLQSAIGCRRVRSGWGCARFVVLKQFGWGKSDVKYECY